MKESQSGMARNWEDEGELFDDPLDDEEYADTQAMEAWLEELEERAIRAEQRRTKIKAPKGLATIREVSRAMLASSMTLSERVAELERKVTEHDREIARHDREIARLKEQMRK